MHSDPWTTHVETLYCILQSGVAGLLLYLVHSCISGCALRLLSFCSYLATCEMRGRIHSFILVFIVRDDELQEESKL